MLAFWQQVKFDGCRMVLRNSGFQFFTLLMPAGYYVLFTKVMSSGTIPMTVSAKYMASMIVYSGTINALFGLAALLLRYREQGLLQWARLTPAGVRPYYLSIGLWSLLMNVSAVAVLGVVAKLVNQVSLTGSQWGSIVLIVLVGQLPTLLLGVLLSFLNRPETLSMLSNLITFPMAILSGLWWPISMLPSWLQPIGKLLPTYFVNDWLGAVVTRGTLNKTNLVGLTVWVVVLVTVVFVVIHQLLKRGDGVVKA